MKNSQETAARAPVTRVRLRGEINKSPAGRPATRAPGPGKKPPGRIHTARQAFVTILKGKTTERPLKTFTTTFVDMKLILSNSFAHDRDQISSVNFGDGVGERLGAKQTCPLKTGAQRASHSLSALAGRHHDGAGCGWGGAGGAAVEMIPLPTL